ncbi:hypothetical protein H2509_01055 [Stappia sp. F7233]|uniref:Basal-body rod modification protein FlgD n=1 Tax=Stappia albiluteola TaxID=2758565 RepID=A0A839A9U4_9HYPH|nr:flagellar hook capping FlgD N-terminal domain-containing protein [Stappia albiluteola]MBA5775707.1 hypothetical protein [Stappia albiluteola]
MVSAVSNTNAATNASSNASQSALSNNYELFLSILTTQIRNQDPLSPADASQYTEQLVQFSSVEQQIKANDQLETILNSINSLNASSFVNYIGSEVTVDVSISSLNGSSAQWKFEAEKAEDVLVYIYNAAGEEVYKGTDTVEAGENSFRWDGLSPDGRQQENGDYLLSVYTLSGDGTPGTNIPVQLKRTVDSVDFSTGSPILDVGGTRVFPGQVVAIGRRA